MIGRKKRENLWRTFQKSGVLSFLTKKYTSNLVERKTIDKNLHSESSIQPSMLFKRQDSTFTDVIKSTDTAFENKTSEPQPTLELHREVTWTPGCCAREGLASVEDLQTNGGERVGPTHVGHVVIEQGSGGGISERPGVWLWLRSDPRCPAAPCLSWGQFLPIKAMQGHQHKYALNDNYYKRYYWHVLSILTVLTIEGASLMFVYWNSCSTANFPKNNHLFILQSTHKKYTQLVHDNEYL